MIVATVFLSWTAVSVAAAWTVDSEGRVYRGEVLGVKQDNPGQMVKMEKQNQIGELKAATGAAEKVKTQEKVQVRTQETNQVQATLKIKVKNNQLELETEGETETEAEYELDDENSTESGGLEVEDREDKNKTRIRAHENAAYVIRNRVAAKTNFPLMVNLETNELMVTTPKGTKAVTVLPDAAVAHMLAANVLDQLGGKGGLAWLEYRAALVTLMPTAQPMGGQATSSAAPTATPSATPTGGQATPTGGQATPISTPSATPEAGPTPEVVDSAEEVIELTSDQDGALIYRIQGTKNKKLFFYMPIELARTVIVSAETGEILGIEQDWLTQLKDWLSV